MKEIISVEVGGKKHESGLFEHDEFMKPATTLEV